MTTELTTDQRQAVQHVEGPLLVLAGPGSGKTRVVTHRIARLVHEGVPQNRILGLTFTNKAAREMAERVERLLDGPRVEISTFHRFCARLIRRWPEVVGLRQNFSILDRSDQVQIVRRIMADEKLDNLFHDPTRVLGVISRSRNNLINAEAYEESLRDAVANPLQDVVRRVFPIYQQRVLGQNAVDFDDLLLHVVRMVEENEEIREFLDERYQFALVDEYQDTNLAQYRIIHAIAQRFPNLCVTGDPDQSIYGWRGARIANITQFERDYPQRKVVVLSDNFRSTQCIVRGADQLISNNPRPHRRSLVSRREEGSAVRLLRFESAEEEAAAIVERIRDAVGSGNRDWADFAIFYRTNALSRTLESAFRSGRVPFQIAAGFAFFERAEIRDLIAYLRAVENPADDSAVQRIINTPARGIGAKTVRQLSHFAEREGTTFFEAAQQVDRIKTLAARSRKAVHRFVDIIERLQETAAEGSVATLLERILSETDYVGDWSWDEDETDPDRDRRANVGELQTIAGRFDADPESDHSLQGFLEQVGLSNETDNLDEATSKVTLMTLHAAKGLEFPVVYVVGVENGLIPHERAIKEGSPEEFAEERRLLYVGMTRAKDELYLTSARERTVFGRTRASIMSPFLDEFEFETTEQNSLSRFGDRDFAPMDPVAVHRERLRKLQRSPLAGAAIMTAADLANGRKATAGETQSCPFRVGDSVRHPRYGRGVVTELSAPSRLQTVTVQFEDAEETQKFVASKCPLQPIG